MKMKASLITALIAVVALTACSKPADTNQTSAAESSSKPAVAADAKPAAAGKADEKQAIEVDKGLLNVEITMPASMFEGQDIDQAIAEAKQEGVSEVTKNADGSLTYKMSKKVHQEMMKKTKDGILEGLKELKSGENFKSVKDVTSNDSFSEFTLVVDKAAYEGSFDGMASFGIGMMAMLYQVMDGVPEAKQKVTINIKDSATNKVFDTVVYPDDTKQ